MSLKATMSLKAAPDALHSEIMAHTPPETRDAVVEPIWNSPLPVECKGH